MLFSKKKKIVSLEKQNERLLNEIKNLEENEIALKNYIEQLKEKVNDLLWEQAHQEGLFDEPEEPDYSEACSCGGTFTPMYDEHPNWIKFCSTCDSRFENYDASPIKEPV
ncbi:hypothetical protein MKX83_24400 [Cytobacillus sp. FSL M8-0252]|uniref:hypothetical protein n=1 Tax=Cytobacillus sp. FSL M8-0252 TaxID=2921621 RepID=UPI0030F50E86